MYFEAPKQQFFRNQQLNKCTMKPESYWQVKVKLSLSMSLRHIKGTEV
jgi:hypothetical protein